VFQPAVNNAEFWQLKMETNVGGKLQGQETLDCTPHDCAVLFLRP
jgi:hypothetical protein